MADKKEAAPEKPKAAEGEAPAKSKKPLAIGGGALGLVIAGWVLSTMAVPKKETHELHLEGPFVAKLNKTDIQANLAGANSKRYLVMSLNAEYFAYEESYVSGRLGTGGGGEGGHGGGAPAEDPVYTAQLKDALLRLGAQKKIEEVTDPVLIDGFLEDIRTVVDPILFPVYVGDSKSPHTPDTLSGLRVGESNSESEFRGLLHEHEIEVDSTKGTLRFDGGPITRFEGDEHDLALVNEKNEKVFLDMTGLMKGFTGKVPIGVPGKVRRIYRDSLLIQ